MNAEKNIESEEFFYIDSFFYYFILSSEWSLIKWVESNLTEELECDAQHKSWVCGREKRNQWHIRGLLSSARHQTQPATKNKIELHWDNHKTLEVDNRERKRRDYDDRRRKKLSSTYRFYFCHLFRTWHNNRGVSMDMKSTAELSTGTLSLFCLLRSETSEIL